MASPVKEKVVTCEAAGREKRVDAGRQQRFRGICNAVSGKSWACAADTVLKLLESSQIYPLLTTKSRSLGWLYSSMMIESVSDGRDALCQLGKYDAAKPPIQKALYLSI